MPDVTLRIDLQDLEDVQAVGVAAVRFGLKLTEVDEGDGPIVENPQLSDATLSVTFDGVQIAVGRFVIDWWKRRQEHERGGLIFDLTEAPATLWRDLTIPYGIVVSETSDGPVVLKVDGIMKDSAERLFGKLSAGAGEPARVIEAAGSLAGAAQLQEQPSSAN